MRRLLACLSVALLSGCGLTLDLQPADDGAVIGFDAGRSDAGRGDAGSDGGPPPPECTAPGDCDDGLRCNGTEYCDLSTGRCVDGTPPDCDDGDACTTDACTEDGCDHTDVECEDGYDCTVRSCDPDVGVCMQVPRNDSCPSSGASCMRGVCDPSIASSDTGCAMIDLCEASGGYCDATANACVFPDCETSCAPIGPCSSGARCEGSTCVQELEPSGTACRLDECQLGSCNATGHCLTTTRSCDDGNPCTNDTCDPASGCEHRDRAPGAVCDTDGSECTREACSGGSCELVETMECLDLDGNPCTGAQCDPSTGVCEFPILVGAPCSDADSCTFDETCATDGTCLPGGPPVPCPPGPALECVEYSCDPLTRACLMEPASDGTPCGIDGACLMGSCVCAPGFEDCDGNGTCECDRATSFCDVDSTGGTVRTLCLPYRTCAGVCSGGTCCACTGMCSAPAECTTPSGRPCPAPATP